MPHARAKRLLILGSTGSIGRQTIEVVTHLNSLHARGLHPDRWEIVGLAAGRNHDVLLAQAAALDVRDIALACDANVAATARSRSLRLRQGPEAAQRLVEEVEADVVLGAMVGFAGVPAMLAAARLGRDIALANKETLVAAGSLIVGAAGRSGSRLLPVDSEHSGVWQCLVGMGGPGDAAACPPMTIDRRIRRVILTASGGALRARSREDTYNATPEDALAHPTWSMGTKVTIDSASLTNKALEIIEAHWLFGLESERIGVLIHPQSIVHAIVEMADGSSIAQMGAPDMRTPIQFALTFPGRADGQWPVIDWQSLGRLDFSSPDLDRFPALSLGYRVVDLGGTSGAVFNAANEAAVEAFLARRIPFGRIAELSALALDEVGVSALGGLDDALAADAEARRFVAARLSGATLVPARRETSVSLPSPAAHVRESRI